MSGQKEEMTYFDEWAKGKNPLISTAALIIAGSADQCLKFMKKFKSGERIEGYTRLSPMKEWLNLYRNHRKVYNGVTNGLRNLDEETAELIDVYEALLQEFRGLRKTTIDEIRSRLERMLSEIGETGINEMKEAIKDFQTYIREDVLDDKNDEVKEPDKETKKKIKAFSKTPEVIFYFRVWAPCWLFYGEYPLRLLRKARNGDEEAINKLLRLDKSIIDDPKIAEIFHQASVAKARGKMDIMTKAMQKTPRMKLEPKTIKYALAGLISIISIALHQKLEPNEIEKLFNAIACDKGEGPIDQDFYDSTGETFLKGVERGRKFWHTIEYRTKNN